MSKIDEAFAYKLAEQLTDEAIFKLEAEFDQQFTEDEWESLYEQINGELEMALVGIDLP